ncbi:MAG TPA: mechanosensitive ion channel family protein [Candidatus Acidoferrum sp.]|nr:mechanosensitive ion channel family protein [Candidatus Acidoferrum sp.]
MPELTEGYKDLILVLAVPGLYCLAVLAGRRLKRAHGVRLGWIYHVFALALAVYVPAILLNLNWAFLRHLGAAVIVLGSFVLMALVDRYIWDLYFQQRHRVQVPKLLTEVMRFVILIVAVFFVLKVGYDQSIKGLLIAPGIAAVVIGLAAQDVLGNILAGVALQLGKPFQHGDWLQVDGRYAQVTEINWRATRLRTVDDISIEIPHRALSTQTIINLNRPQRRHAMRLSISLDYAAPPNRAKSVLLHAVANAKGVLPVPKPQVFLKNFGDSAIEYEVRFWLEEYETYYEVCDAIRSNMWYSLRRHGIRIPFPIRTVQLERPARDKQLEVQTAARIMLRQQPLFRCLNDDQLDALLPRGQVVHFGRDEKLIQQGDSGESMFILVDGEATVIVERNGAPTPVAFLRAGDCFGEMSLLTGERRSATVIAQTDCEVVEIGKAVLARSLKENPELVAQLSELLARRQLETEGALAAGRKDGGGEGQQSKYTDSFLDKLRTFFEL